MGNVDWESLFGIEPEDRKRWDEMNAAAEKRIKERGGVEHYAKEAADSGLNLAQKAAAARMQAAQNAGRDDARTTRPRRRVVIQEEKTEFLDDDPQFG
ncbi:hypothetical protein [Nocardiopsis sp. M1B1]|uniref:hypothetical protein n=1 Tax=Nocardiopsis sp. M1B1 TaxID=3450454 RepID=UPI004039D0C4